jgi:hypothetical protein
VSSGFCFGFLVGIGGLLGSPKGRECAGSPERSRAWRRRFRVTTLDRPLFSPHLWRRAVESSARARIRALRKVARWM